MTWRLVVTSLTGGTIPCICSGAILDALGYHTATGLVLGVEALAYFVGAALGAIAWGSP